MKNQQLQVSVATDTMQPVVNGPSDPEIKVNGDPSSSVSSPMSMDGQLSPSEQVFRSPSPYSTSSQSSSEGFRRRGDSIGSSGRSFEFGKFYNTSYLKDGDPKYMKRASSGRIVPGKPLSPNFHRPENFSYTTKSSTLSNLAKPTKRGAMGVLVNSIQRRQIRSKSPVALNNEEAIKLSHFPGGHRPAPREPAPIERDDWPGPPCAAAVFPEMKRLRQKSKQNVSRSEESDQLDEEDPVKLAAFPSAKVPEPNRPPKIELDDWPGPACMAVLLPELLRERRKSRGEKDEEEEEEEPPVDEKVQKELVELEKASKESPMSQSILKDLQQKVEMKRHKVIDPVSASRTPAADHEPKYRTRFESHLYASPSRYSDHLRRHSEDLLQSTPNDYPRRDVRSTSTLPGHMSPPKPGYTGGCLSGSRSKSATMPISGGPPLSHFSFDMDHSQSGDELEKLERRSAYTSMSSVSNDGSKRSQQRTSSIADGPPFINSALLSNSRKNLFMSREEQNKEPDQPIPYEELSTNPPRGLDRNRLESYLSNAEFEGVFGMTRENFNRLPGFKQSDLKKKTYLL